MWTARALADRRLAALLAPLTALACVVVLMACDATTTPPPREPAQSDGTFQAGSGATGGSPAIVMSTAGAGVSSSGSSSSSADASAPLPANGARDAGQASARDAGVASGMSSAGAAASQPDAGTRCMVGATPVDMCPLPASSCVSDSALMFFENPRCLDGHCVWDARLMRCPGGDCNGSVCGSNLTLL